MMKAYGQMMSRITEILKGRPDPALKPENKEIRRPKPSLVSTERRYHRPKD